MYVYLGFRSIAHPFSDCALKNQPQRYSVLHRQEATDAIPVLSAAACCSSRTLSRSLIGGRLLERTHCSQFASHRQGSCDKAAHPRVPLLNPSSKSHTHTVCHSTALLRVCFNRQTPPPIIHPSIHPSIHHSLSVHPSIHPSSPLLSPSIRRCSYSPAYLIAPGSFQSYPPWLVPISFLLCLDNHPTTRYPDYSPDPVPPTSPRPESSPASRVACRAVVLCRCWPITTLLHNQPPHHHEPRLGDP